MTSGMPRRSLVLTVALWGLLAGAGWALAEGLAINDRLMASVSRLYGAGAITRLKDWAALLDALEQGDERRKLEGVNGFFNTVEFKDDPAHWGKPDYWATPVEFLASNGGDCEDFAIAKYFTLRALGLSADAMRLAYVKSLSLNQAHVVLVYYTGPTRKPLVLDNLVQDILPASQRTDLVPVYSFNADGLWQQRQQGHETRLGSGDDVLMWKEMIQRMQAQDTASADHPTRSRE